MSSIHLTLLLFQLKGFADDSFKFDENHRKFSNRADKTLWENGELLLTRNFSFSHIALKKLVLQTRENQGVFGEGLSRKIPKQTWPAPVAHSAA